MLKALFNKLFKSSVEVSKGNFIVAQLNDKIMPIDRGDVYEDPLDEYLKLHNLGEVTGGGTLQKESGEIEYCDVEIKLNSELISESDLQLIVLKLEELGAPKGSKLIIELTNHMIEFGRYEGLAIYLDGVNLPKHVYKEADINEVASELTKLISDTEPVQRYWEGNTGTALYFYRSSFDAMNSAIADYVSSHPLCQGARIKQIA